MAYKRAYTTSDGRTRYNGYARLPLDKIVTKIVTLPEGGTEEHTILRPQYKGIGAYDTADEALAAAEAEEARLRTGSDVSPAQLKKITVEKFLPMFLRWHRKELNTLNGYAYLLNRFFLPAFGRRHVADIQHSELQNFFIMLEEGTYAAADEDAHRVQPATLKHLRAAVNAFFTVARRHGVRDDEVSKGLAVVFVPAKDQECWDMPTYAIFRKHLPNRPARTFADLQVFSGARIGEMVVMRVSDFNFETGELTISRAAMEVPVGTKGADNRIIEANRTKTKRTRRISLGDNVLALIQQYIHDYNLGPEDLLFPARLVTPSAVYYRQEMTLEEKQADCAKQPTPTSRTGITYEHGTINAYVTGKCKGAWCRAVGTEYSARKRAEKAGRTYVPGQKGKRRSTNAYLNIDSWNRMFNKAQDASGIEYRIPPKNLRHTHAVFCLEDLGMSGEKVAKRMGHTKEVLLSNYYVRRAGTLEKERTLFDTYVFDFAA